MKQWRAAGSPKDKVAEINMTTVFSATRRSNQFVIPITMRFRRAASPSQPIENSAGDHGPRDARVAGAGTFFDVDSGELPGVTCGAVGVYCCAAYGPNGTVAAENSTTPCSTLVRDAVYGLVYRRTIVSLVPDDEQA
ncbi:phosphorelay sensor kinase [Aureococcus anophagefferens]|nr:phosphorelay sensor kinase [Aureococcus anophagefferens]